MKGKCYDDHSAVYHLLEDKLHRHMLKSQLASVLPTAAAPVAAPTPQPTAPTYPPTLQAPVQQQRRSSITAGTGMFTKISFRHNCY